MNTEKFVITKSNSGYYYNKVTGFYGTLAQAQDYAKEKNYGGGVEIQNKTRTNKKKPRKILFAEMETRGKLADETTTEIIYHLLNTISFLNQRNDERIINGMWRDYLLGDLHRTFNLHRVAERIRVGYGGGHFYLTRKNEFSGDWYNMVTIFDTEIK